MYHAFTYIYNFQEKRRVWLWPLARGAEAETCSILKTILLQ